LTVGPGQPFAAPAGTGHEAAGKSGQLSCSVPGLAVARDPRAIEVATNASIMMRSLTRAHDQALNRFLVRWL
jgi:hypothetical protein